MKVPCSPATKPSSDPPPAQLGQGKDPRSLTLALKQEAARLGFLAVGVLSPDALNARREELHRWLDNGYAGGLTYMESFFRRQEQLLKGFPDLRSILVLAAPYGGREPAQRPAMSAEPAGRVARYAQGRDYHRAIRKRIRRLEAFIRARAGDTTRTQHNVDKGPLQERALAEAAGLGFIGKNTMLIHPKAGSFLFLGVLLTNLDLLPDRPISWDCGNCTLCLDACPTDALVSPYQLDAGRCIANLTIENRGAIPPELRPLVGDWLFGCDICQEVCPYNKGPALPEPLPAGPGHRADAWPEFSATAGAGTQLPLQELLLSREEASGRYAGTPLMRAKRAGLLRNAAVAAGNLAAPELSRPLANLLQSDPDALVRAHAAWALGRIRSKGTAQLLSQALQTEQDPMVRKEIQAALQEEPQ